MIHIIPNRQAAPLNRDARLAECYLNRPGRLMELAQETGNRSLRSLAYGIMRHGRKKPHPTGTRKP